MTHGIKIRILFIKTVMDFKLFISIVNMENS